MKITLQSEILQKKLPFLNHAISNRNDLPVLLNFLLIASGNTVTLSSTDLEIGIHLTIPAHVEEEGGITIPAKTFTELIASLPQESVTLITTGNSLTLESKRTKSTFQTIAKEEFPKLYEEKGELLATVDFEDFKKDASMVVFSASNDTTRPALSGSLLRNESSGFLLVSTDGYRLSLKHHSVKSIRSSNDESLVIPARVMREVLSMKDGAKEVSIFISKGSNQVIFELGETLLIGRLIGAEFPPFEKIIPSDHASQIAFDREELLKAVKICSIFARDAANIITLSLKKESIIVSSQNPSLGDNTVTVEANLTGEENDIAFNARYLLDALSNIPEDILIFQMTGPLNPGVFKIKDNESFLHLIMPIRLPA